MTEENKDVKAAPAPSAEGAAEKKETAPAAVAKVKVEKPTNCAKCNKVIKKIRWYYRNGKAYCNKRCWKLATEKKDDKPAEPAAK